MEHPTEAMDVESPRSALCCTCAEKQRRQGVGVAGASPHHSGAGLPELLFASPALAGVNDSCCPVQSLSNDLLVSE